MTLDEFCKATQDDEQAMHHIGDRVRYASSGVGTDQLGTIVGALEVRQTVMGKKLVYSVQWDGRSATSKVISQNLFRAT